MPLVNAPLAQAFNPGIHTLPFRRSRIYGITPVSCNKSARADLLGVVLVVEVGWVFCGFALRFVRLLACLLVLLACFALRCAGTLSCLGVVVKQDYHFTCLCGSCQPGATALPLGLGGILLSLSCWLVWACLIPPETLFPTLSQVILGWRREPCFNNNPAGAIFHEVSVGLMAGTTEDGPFVVTDEWVLASSAARANRNRPDHSDSVSGRDT